MTSCVAGRLKVEIGGRFRVEASIRREVELASRLEVDGAPRLGVGGGLRLAGAIAARPKVDPATRLDRAVVVPGILPATTALASCRPPTCSDPTTLSTFLGNLVPPVIGIALFGIPDF